jgi:hypothetical protein
LPINARDHASHQPARLTHLEKQPEAGRELQHGDLLAKKIDRIRWRAWHGRPLGALDLIDELLEELEMPNRQIQLTAVYIKKLTGVLREL